MIKIFCNLILLTFVITVITAFAQKPVKSPRKEILTVQGDTNRPLQPPPPAPLIYKAPNTSDLKDFVSEDKTFQATFPGTPKITKQEVENGFVTSYRVYRYGSNSIVNVLDYNSDLENYKEKIFENIKNSFIKSPKTTIQAERDFQFKEKTGKEFDVLQDFNYQRVRLLVVGTRVYELISDATNWHIIGEVTKKQFFAETERFFNSFEHLKSPEKVVPPAPEGFLGEVKDTTYRNAFFNFSFDFPGDWYRLGEAEMSAAKKGGLEILKTEREKTNHAFAEATQKEVALFALSQGKFGSQKSANLVIGVLKQSNSQIDSMEVLRVSKNFLLTNPKITLFEDVQRTQLNGTEFSTVTLKTTVGSESINQKIFTTMRKGYSVTFVLTYKTSEELKSLEKFFGSLRFTVK